MEKQTLKELIDNLKYFNKKNFIHPVDYLCEKSKKNN